MRKSYFISLALFAVVFVGFVATAIVGAQQFATDFTEAKAADAAAETKLEPKSGTKSEPAAGDISVPTKSEDPGATTRISPAAPAPVDNPAPGPERIPFTNELVTPGNPESYQGTYGQCPFYENAGEKGCFPPSDLTCNADWSYCVPKSTTTNQEDTNATEQTGALRTPEPGATSQDDQGL